MITFPLTVKSIIQKEGKILVLKRASTDDHRPGVWETPGGGMDRKESPQEALIREIQEETGLTVEIERPFYVFTFTKDTGEYKIGISFLSRYVSGEVELSHEHEAYRWIDPKEFKDLPSISSLYQEIALYSQQV